MPPELLEQEKKCVKCDKEHDLYGCPREWCCTAPYPYKCHPNLSCSDKNCAKFVPNWKQRFGELLIDYGFNVAFDGDPKRTKGTTPEDVESFVAKEILKSYLQGRTDEKEKLVAEVFDELGLDDPECEHGHYWMDCPAKKCEKRTYYLLYKHLSQK